MPVQFQCHLFHRESPGRGCSFQESCRLRVCTQGQVVDCCGFKHGLLLGTSHTQLWVMQNCCTFHFRCILEFQNKLQLPLFYQTPVSGIPVQFQCHLFHREGMLLSLTRRAAGSGSALKARSLLWIQTRIALGHVNESRTPSSGLCRAAALSIFGVFWRFRANYSRLFSIRPCIWNTSAIPMPFIPQGEPREGMLLSGELQALGLHSRPGHCCGSKHGLLLAMSMSRAHPALGYAELLHFPFIVYFSGLEQITASSFLSDPCVWNTSAIPMPFIPQGEPREGNAPFPDQESCRLWVCTQGQVIAVDSNTDCSWAHHTPSAGLCRAAALSIYSVFWSFRTNYSCFFSIRPLCPGLACSPLLKAWVQITR
nr:uncharacterized protein LOC106630162 [Zonotrichia albicollis]XP_014129767.1 uncharacterized protein LOC106630162 [Zonotrichia albicollis]XP_026654747.1 uncharacterized protein LOC106630162 [Zonotrichia albicollis]XP_026654748.1 uncharacterized protein LOC106630162 [Zonotrichia albicollis]